MKPFFNLMFFALLFSFSCKSEKKDNTTHEDNKVNEVKPEHQINIDGLLYEANMDGIINKGDYDETVGVYTKNRLGVSKKALSMDGLGEYIKVKNHEKINPLKGITISLWYKPISFKGSGNDPIVLKPSINGEEPYIQYFIGVTGNEYPSLKAQGSFKFALSINGKYALLKTPANIWIPDVWYNLTGTYDGERMKFFINGNLVNAKTFKDGKLDIYNTDMFVGRTLDNKINTPGVYDNLRIFNRALTNEEIGMLNE